MDQNRNSQDQQGSDQQDLDRNQDDRTVGRGNEGERNSGGISNRDMDEQSEQSDPLSDRDRSQSER